MVKNKKKKGCDAERELQHMFWKEGWACVRVAGSGSTRHPSPDIIASNGKYILAIEIKVINSFYKYIKKEQVDELKEFSKKFGAQPWIAIKFKRKPWMFISVEDMKETTKGYVIDIDKGNIVGLKFEELIKLLEDI